MARLPRYFSHYWLEETCRWEKEHYTGEPFRHTASNLLRKRGVEPRDFIYGWSFSGGKLLLVGRMQVGRFVSQREADALYKAAEGWAWKAADHIFAKPGTGTPMRFDNAVPPSLIRKLSFLDPTGHVKPPKFIGKDKVDPQTFRAVRELTQQAARLLDELINGGSARVKPPLEKTVESDLDSLRVEEQFEEGGNRVRYTNYYERNAKLRIAAINYHGTTCRACGFDFGHVYGERGAGFIEVHHLRPVSNLKKKRKIDPKKDMTVLCSNCHRMIHRRKDNVLSVEDLKRAREYLGSECLAQRLRPIT
jgi:HNH endonuclease